MSAQDPRLPTSGITLRILRDDLKTYAGVTAPAESFSLAAARARLAAAPGLSGAEIAKANTVNFPGSYVVREPVAQGPGWCIFNAAAGRVAYVVRDDGSHLSFGEPPAIFTVARAQAAFNATAGLTGAETARIAAMALTPQA